MRIIGGKYKGRRIEPPARLPVRPTTDFAKEGLFNVLNNSVDLEGMDVLDLFAGTGSISFEFISRACASVTAIDRDLGCVKFINATAAKLGEEHVRAQQSDVFRYIGFTSRQFHLIFADPPFDLDNAKLLPRIIFEKNLLHVNGLLIMEHSERVDFSTLPQFTHTRHYGKVNFSFFSSEK